MEKVEALAIVLELAAQNVCDNTDDDMQDEVSRQEEALCTVALWLGELQANEEGESMFLREQAGEPR